ncbi:MAG: hypothetical protein ABEJ91_01755, partial [Candidatus Nanohaloarchaea archaeon]
ALGEYTINGYCNGTKVSSATDSDYNPVYIAEMNPEIVQPSFNQLAYREHFMGEESRHGELYKGKPVKVDLGITGLSGFEANGKKGWRALEISKPQLSFPTRIPEYSNQPLDSAPFRLDDDTISDGLEDQVVELHPYIPADMPGRHKSVAVTVNYEGDYGSVTTDLQTEDDALFLTGIRTLEMKPEEDITKSQVGDIELKIYVESSYRNYVSAERFNISAGGETYSGDFQLTKVQNQPGVYELKLNKRPSQMPDSEKFDLDIVYSDPVYSGESGIEIASYNVYSDFVRFRGYSWDSQKQPVKTSFNVDGRSFSTNSNGFFQQKFVPGEYDFNISFSKGGKTASLNLNDVEMKSRYEPSKTRIRYEYRDNPSGVNAPGVKAMDLVSFAFRKPFTGEGSTVTIDYEVSGSDPTKVQVLSCDNWAMSDSKCLSSWEKVQDTSFSPGGGWSVTVPATSYQANYLGQQRNIMRSAYIIGTQSGLRLNGPLTVKAGASGRVKSGGEITFQGQLVAGGSAGVEGANITVSMLEDGSAVKKFTGKTDGSGSFEISGKVPGEPGNYTLKLTANKPPYDSFSTTRDTEVWVYRERAIELTKKDSDRWKLQPGKETRKTVVVENTGQTAIEDIKLAIRDSENFNTDYLSLATTDLGTLEPGEKSEADLVFDIPSSCPGTGCAEFSSSINLEASGKGASSKLNVGPQIVAGESSGGSKEGEQQNKTGGGMSLSASDIPGARATGQFLAAQSTLNIALGLMFVFLMVLAGALKNKDGDDRNVRRNVVRGSSGGSSRPGVQPPRVSPAHENSEELDSPKTVDTNGHEEDEEAEESEESGESKGKVEKLADSLTGSGGEGSDGQEEKDEADEGRSDDPSVECDICGEEFDTEAGVKLHKQTAH